MNISNEKIQRLRRVLSKIESSEKDERHFNELYKLLLEEYIIEGGESAVYRMGSYNHNLRQTRDKQAKSYLSAKKRRPVKGAPEEYRDFTRNFKQDVTDVLGMYRFEEPS